MKGKKTILGLLTLGVLIFPCCSSQPDDIVPEIGNMEMRKNLVHKYDVNSDGKLTPDEVKCINKYYISSVEGELSGLEYLTDLEVFDASYLNDRVLDLRKNKKLESVDISNMKELGALNVNSNVQEIKVAEAERMNKFTLGSMPFLRSLIVINSPIQEISTGDCPSLTHLNVDDTMIRELDLSKFPRLESLHCSFTGVQELDLSGLPNLEVVRCKGGVSKIILSPDQKIVGVNIAPDYKNCIDKDVQIITKK